MLNSGDAAIIPPTRTALDWRSLRQAIRPRTIIALAWIVFAVSGLLVLLNYSRTAGRSAPAPAVWPDRTKLPRESGSWSLVLFCHPRCPCSRATLRELERLMPLLGENVDVRVCFFKPDEVDAEWVFQDIWSIAGSIRDVQRIIDEGGHEARRFGALTSGNAVLYGPDGRLRFHGGITPARGHEGPNIGVDAIRKFVAGQPCETTWAETFGCPLLE